MVVLYCAREFRVSYNVTDYRQSTVTFAADLGFNNAQVLSEIYLVRMGLQTIPFSVRLLQQFWC